MIGSDGVGLLIFLLQQFGVTLAVGSSTFAMMFYIVGKSSGEIDPSEKRFIQTVYATMRVGLILILSTGVLTTAAHYFAGEIPTLTSPVFIFKWILLVIIVLTATLMDQRLFSSRVGGTIAGASWYTLFIIHTLSLSFSWSQLIWTYLVWLAVFWLGFTLLHRRAVRMYSSEATVAVPPGASIVVQPTVAVPARMPAPKN